MHSENLSKVQICLAQSQFKLYDYNVCKPKAKFWLLLSLLVDENTKFVFFKQE